MSGQRSDNLDEDSPPPADGHALQHAAARFGAMKATAWLKDQLIEERKQLQKRHDELVSGMEKVFKHAYAEESGEDTEAKNNDDAKSEASSNRIIDLDADSHNNNGRNNHSSERTASKNSRKSTLSRSDRASSRKSTLQIKTEIMRARGFHEGGTKSFHSTGLRMTQELTDVAMTERGLNMPIQTRSVSLERRFAQHDGDSAVVRYWKTLERCAGELVMRSAFDYTMGAIIVANCVTIGLEIQLSIENSSSDLLRHCRILEHVFLASYVVEIVIRMLGGGMSAFKSAWFQLDFVLVLLGVVSIWLLEPALDISGGALELVDKVLVIRILRLVRLVRALRFLKFMQPLWKLVSGLLGSARTVTSAAFLLFGAMYVFACAGVALLGADDDLMAHTEAGPLVHEHFKSIPLLMMTLFQFTSCDSVAQIYQPLIRAKPILVLYFLPILLVIPISLMNLITAVIVDHAIQCSTHDAELERCRLRGRLKNLIPLLNKMFQEFDLSCTGEINLAELDLTRMSMPLPQEVLEVLKSHKLRDFFNLLDADASGRIDQTEWVDGMCCLVLNEVPIENLQMLHLLARHTHELEDIKKAVVPESSRAGDETEEEQEEPGNVY